MSTALPDKARLVLVGDVYQLPSVGPGNILKDLISSGRVPVVELTRIHRQSRGSWISRNAHAIKNGNLKSLKLNTEDFAWFEAKGDSPADKAQRAQEEILTVIQRLLDIGWPGDSIQVLTPMYKTPVGVKELNSRIQEILNPSGQPMRLGNRVFRLGDRVMQLKNSYEKEVFNGDQGRVCEFSEETGEIKVDFQGNIATYSSLELDDIALGYACTIHKSQGSEFPVVIMPVSSSHYIMLQRNLIYTGITRAKEICILVGEKRALSISVKNDKPILRNTRLGERISIV